MNEPSLNAEVALALERFGLITMDQAEEAIANYKREWRQAWEDSQWWGELAKIAWENETSWWKRFLYVGIPPFQWRWDWIKEKRGW